MAKVIIPTPLRKFTQNASEVDVNGSETVREAIETVATKFPALEQYLLNADRSIKGFIRIYLGEEDINQMEGGDTKITERDTISIIPAIAGGTA